MDLLLDQEKNSGAHTVDPVFCIMERTKEKKGQSANMRRKSVACDSSKQPESIRHAVRKAKDLKLRKHGLSSELSKMKVVMLCNNCWCWFLLCFLGLLHPPLLVALAEQKLGLGEKCPRKWAFLSGCKQTHLCPCLRAYRHISRSCWRGEILSEWLL